MTKKKKYILLFLLALVAYAALLPVRGYSFKMATGLHCAFFFALTLWALWRYGSQLNPWGIILSMVLPWFSECGISTYPHVLILDKQRNVIFNGSLEFAKRKLASLDL